MSLIILRLFVRHFYLLLVQTVKIGIVLSRFQTFLCDEVARRKKDIPLQGMFAPLQLAVTASCPPLPG